MILRSWHKISILILSIVGAVSRINADQGNPYKPAEEINYDKFLQFDWVIAGCQPISLAAIGSLLDQGISSNRIFWISDSFTITLNNSTIDNRAAMGFLNACKAFKPFTKIIEQYKRNPADTITPQQILQFIIKKLREQIQSTTIALDTLCFEPSIKRYSFSWYTNTVLTKNIILTSPYFPNTQNTLRSAETNTNSFASQDVVAVIGSLAEGNYAISLLREYQIKKIIHFYTDKETAPTQNSHNTPADAKKTDTTPATPPPSFTQSNTTTNSSSAMQTPCEIIRVAHTPDQAFALLPECTRIVYCPSAPPERLPQFINIPFYATYQDTHAYAPGLFLLNPEALRKTNKPVSFIEYMVITQEHIKNWLLNQH